jgi:CheY-like chemotaxis protein
MTKILVIEEEEAVRDVISEMLEAENFEVIFEQLEARSPLSNSTQTVDTEQKKLCQLHISKIIVAN